MTGKLTLLAWLFLLHHQTPQQNPKCRRICPIALILFEHMHILVINGPNLNMLGSREPTFYGTATLEQINQRLIKIASDAGFSLQNYQSNHEGALIDRIQQAHADGTQFIIINPAGYSHTSVALRDAMAAVALPFVEVHLSNIHQRDKFRHFSYFSELAKAVVCGMGSYGYEAALEYAIRYLQEVDRKNQ